MTQRRIHSEVLKISPKEIEQPPVGLKKLVLRRYRDPELSRERNVMMSQNSRVKLILWPEAKDLLNQKQLPLIIGDRNIDCSQFSHLLEPGVQIVDCLVQRIPLPFL